MLAKEYGWNLKEIRALAPKDFQAHMGVCMIAQRIGKVRAYQESFIQSAKKSLPTIGIPQE